MNPASALDKGGEGTARWSLRLFGGFELNALPGGERVALPGKRERVLLAYLALSPNCRQQRRKLATLLWGDAGDETALDNLRTCVWALRKALGDTAHRAIASEGEDIVLDAAAFFHIDALAFRRSAAQSGRLELEAAANLYSGELLDGLGIENDEFESWRRAETARYRDQAIDVLTRLMTQLCECGETEAAIEAGTRILRLEPLHEPAVRRLIRLYGESGRRGPAIQLYRALADALKTELDAQPDAETRAIFAEVSRGSEEPTPAPPAANRSATPTISPRIEAAQQQAGVAVARAASATSVGATSVAVLPFVNMSGDANQDFFSDGMTEEITTALAKVSGLIVIGRTSAFEFKGQNKDLRAIGRALGATHLIEGSVRMTGNRVRISAQLIEAGNGAHLWAESYNRELTDIFAIQEDIAQAIAGALRVPLNLQQGEHLVSNRAIDVDSYQQYLRAKALVRARRLKPLTDAAAMLEGVVAHDSLYAPAWAQLALAYTLMPNYCQVWFGGSADELRRIVDASLPKAEAAARRAIHLDPNDPDGYMSLAVTHDRRGKFLLAEENYSKALALDPNNPDVLHSYSLMLAGVGRVKEALAMRQQLQTQEPFVPVFNGQTACLQWLNGQNDAAIATIKTLPPGAARSDIGRADLARMYVAAGRYSEAADLLLETSSGDYSLETMKEAARILRAAPATAASSENLPRFGGPLNYIYLHTGIPDRALEFYEGSVEAGYLVSASTDALWHSSYVAVRKTERFKAFVRKAGLVDYWRARGWPEFCHPTSADDFVCELPPADSAPGLPRPDKPSIAVLAFQNMSGDPEQEFFADGIAEDIITTLSKSRGLFVIARNSSFSYKGKTVDIRQIGRELGVRYVLEGSVRKSGNRVRITAQLIDATDGHHVWAERYDRALEDIFAIQDEMTHNIIGAIAPEIVAAEIQRSLGKEVADLGQWERLMRAHWHIGRFTPEDSSEARRLLGELVLREPNNTLALSTLAQAWLLAGVFGWTKEPLSVAMGIGGQYARRAVAADDQDAAAHAVLASAEVFGGGRHDDGIRRFLRAIELDPNSSSARGFLGAAYAFGGECEPAIQRSQEALRLSPRDFLMVLWHIQIAWAYLSVENYEQTAENAKRAMECSPTFPDTHALYAVAAANLGRMADARAGIAEFSRLLPGLTLHDERLNRPFRRAEDRKRWLSGLKKAGLPE